MALQTALLCKRLSTMGARESLLTSMYQHVHFQSVLSPKSLGADVALELPYPGMFRHVILQLTFGEKPHIAIITLVFSLQ